MNKQQIGSGARVFGAISVMVLGACAHAPTDPAARAEFNQTNDPAEPTNRRIFAVNQYVDKHAIRPVALVWVANVPRPVRGCVHNFSANLGQPEVAVNDVLQGNLGRAWMTTQRFVINTTIGGVGLFDVATDWHRPGHEADVGQTLGVWGIAPGPAVQLPLLGPSNVRDAVGKLASIALSPTTYVTGGALPVIEQASSGLTLVDGRARLLNTTDALEKNSLDYYAALRSAVAQRRAALVAEGKSGGTAAPRLKETTTLQDETEFAPTPRPL